MMACHLSAELRKTHKRRSIRVVPGDSIKVVRGVYRDVPGKVEKVIPGLGVVISGTKKEKTAGDAYDVYITPSNMIITALDTGDSWRTKKLKREKGKPAKEQAIGESGDAKKADDIDEDISENAKKSLDTEEMNK